MKVKKVIKQGDEYICEIDVSVVEWKEVLQDETLMNDNYKDVLLKFLSEPEHKSTCKALGDKYGLSPQSFNGSITNFAKAVQKKLNRFEVIGTDGTPSFWIIPMKGKNVGDHFEWTLRPELVQAIDELKINHSINYWTFKHKPGTKGAAGAKEFVEKALSLNSVLMQYEYGYQDKRKVTQNWNRIKEVKKGDIIFLRGDDHIYAVGNVINPRKKSDKRLSIDYILSKQSHGDDISGKFDGCIHFNESEVFYEDLSEGENGWGQRIDVDGWKFYYENGIKSKGQENYFAGENEFGVLKKLKREKAISFLNQLRNNFMGTEAELLKNNKNIILTGAPGTGKTYLAKQLAMKMILGKNSEDLLTKQEKEQFKKCFCFVQFHPSYDYTDFVEGLRPTAPDENGNIGFELKDGIFKSFCQKASESKLSDIVDNFDESWENLLSKVRNSIAMGSLTKIGSWDYGLSSKDSLKYSSINTPSQYNFTITKKNVYCAYQGKQARPSGAFQKDMEDVVNYMKENFGLKNFVDRQENKNNETENFVFVIDEINRGEISKIFGELFFSIDPSYRGKKGAVKTQYSNLHENEKEDFYVPENVYIIGTMNDIDRSVESFDFAMRRRFTWKEITAEESAINMNICRDKEEYKKSKIGLLNEQISNIEGLNDSYHIGAAYFLDSNGNARQDYSMIWDLRIEPLLREYLRGIPDGSNKLEILKNAYRPNENN